MNSVPHSKSKIRVGVLRGGPSDEYAISLKTGGTILKHLSSGEDMQDRYIPQDILIDREGNWHVNGIERQPHEALAHVDVVWNALHGYYGEDGKVQRILDQHGIPYTGSGELPSAVGMNKVMAKEIFLKNGIRTPRYIHIENQSILGQSDLEKVLLTAFRTFALPFVVKPVSSGSSVGVTIVRGFHEFEDAVRHAFKFDDTVMVEEFIAGVEATCGVVDGLRDVDIYALPPIEIRPHLSFFDHAAKYEGKADEIVPGNFSFSQKDEIMALARAVHAALGLRHYSRTDFIVTPRRGIYVLEVNTLPGMTEGSLLPKALGAVGIPLPHFIDHVIGLAMGRK